MGPGKFDDYGVRMQVLDDVPLGVVERTYDRVDGLKIMRIVARERSIRVGLCRRGSVKA
jgi:hypothetical protein